VSGWVGRDVVKVEDLRCQFNDRFVHSLAETYTSLVPMIFCIFLCFVCIHFIFVL